MSIPKFILSAVAAAAAGAGGGGSANSLLIDAHPVLVDGFSIVFA